MAGWLEIAKALGPYVGAAGQVAGGISSGRQAGRAAETQALQSQDVGALNRYIAEQNARQAAATLQEQIATRATQTPEIRAKQAALGDLLSNIQDVEIGGLPSYIPKVKFSGGLRPSALGPLARQGGQNLAQQAVLAQMTGSDLPPPGYFQSLGLGGSAPAQSPLPQASGMDSFLNVLSTIGQIANIPGEVQRGKEAEEERKETAAERRARTAWLQQQARRPQTAEEIVMAANLPPVPTLPRRR